MDFTVKDRDSMTMEERVTDIEQNIAGKMLKEFGGSIENAFQFADRDLSGAIDEAEFRGLLRTLDINVDDETFDALMERYDEDGNRAISLTEFELRYRFQRQHFINFLHQRQEERELLLSTPYTMLFFVVFVALLYVRDETAQMYSIGSGFKANIFDVETMTSQITFEDVYGVGDFYEWLEEVLVPQTMVQTNEFIGNIPLQRDAWGRVSVYGRLMGTGIVLQQWRSVEQNCEGPLGNYSGTCYTSGLSTESYGVPFCSPRFVNNTCFDANGLDSATLNTLEQAFNYSTASESYMAKLNINQTQQWNLGIVDGLRDREWIDEQTRHITITLATFNGEISTFTYVNFELEQVGGGYFIPSTARTLSMRANVYEHVWVYGLEALWLLLVILNAITEFREMATAARENGGNCSTYWKEDGWNYVDWVQIIFAITSSLFFFTIVQDTTTLAVEYSMGDTVDIGDEEPLIVHLGSILDKMTIYRTLALINMVILLLRFFKAFRGQPRLAVITRSFVIAGVDISHFLLIYFCILMAFVASAVFLFGQHVHRYHDWGRAIGWCFWSLTGEFFWNEVHFENPTMAIIWWWSYLLIMYLVLTNMLVAMILDAFYQANNEQASKVSMIAQIINLCKSTADAKRGGLIVDELLSYLGEDSDDEEDDNNDDDTGNSGDTESKSEKVLITQDNAETKVDSGEDSIARNKMATHLCSCTLLSMSEIFKYWELCTEPDITPVARDTTEQFLIDLLRDFCIWNMNDDITMRQILEKNAFSQLAEIDNDFAPLQKRVDQLFQNVRWMAVNITKNNEASNSNSDSVSTS